MADKSSQLVLAALTRAAADPGGVPLFTTRTGPGLFPATTAGKQAAQKCRDEGYLSETNGTAFAISERGMGYLFSHVSPRQVLEDFVRVVEGREHQVKQLATQVCSMLAGLEGMRANLNTVLEQLGRQSDLKALCKQFHEQPAAADPMPVIVSCLKRWKGPDDCPVPELYRMVAASQSGLTVGAFHDALRKMKDQERVYLHPWTGPLYAVPEPRFALLDGHSVAYFVSLQPHQG